MKLHRLAHFVSCLFVVGLLSAAAGEALFSASRSGDLTQSGSSSCPDRNDDGNPCGPTCACACCPGHSIATALVAARPFLGVAPLQDRRAPSSDDLHPKDVAYRIFHPPRA